MRIMTVDDSSVARTLVRRAIEAMGHEAVEAADGKEALELLGDNKERPVALILLDWNMPTKDGMQTLLALKADPELRDIPVTMVTTEVERSKVVGAVRAGAVNYVMKPFRQEDLVAKIMESLGMGT